MLRVFEDFTKNGFTVPENLEQEIFNLLLNELGKQNISDLTKEELQQIFEGIDSLLKNNANYNCKEIYYAIYYLPQNLYKIWTPLKDLQTRNTLAQSITVLDIGCGPGTSTFGLIEYYKFLASENTDVNYKITIDVLEQNPEFINLFQTLLENYKKCLPQNLQINLRNKYNENLLNGVNYLNENYDLIYESNVFNNKEPNGDLILKDILKQLKHNLNRHGSIILIEPALQGITPNFKKICNALNNEKILNIYSPCNGVYVDCIRCQKFAPALIKKINSRLITFLRENNKRIKEGHFFDYYILRKDGLIKYQHSAKKKYTPLNNINWQDQLVNIEAVVVSIIEKDDLSIILCDGSNSTCSISLQLSKLEMEKLGLNMQLLKGEKIYVCNALIKQFGVLTLCDKSKLEVIY